ncbi:MAG: response regulator transcription factor [Chloroflexi bacterium]|nr:response regulator transcription factor [Chloroflexota bacterium]
MTGAKILIVEDEEKIAELVRLYLERDGFRVVAAASGDRGLSLFRKEGPSLILLDVSLPGMDGLEVCRAIRRESNVPIIMLTARAEDTDKLIGLELGADDYITKPFSPREVVARVRAVLRRSSGVLAEQNVISVRTLTVDRGRHQARLGDALLPLTASEFKLLATLAQQPGRVFTRTQLLDAVVGEAYEGYERTIDVHIKNLRRKLAAVASNGPIIVTVRGVGYALEAGDEARSP